MNISHNLIVRGLQILSHVVLLVGVIIAIIEKVSIIPYLPVVISYMLVVGTLGTNIGLHRLLSHKSFETWKPIEYFCAFLGTISLIGSPIAWCAAHRYHHANSDKDTDIHSPIKLGAWHAWFGFWPEVSIPARTVADLTKDKFYRFLHKHYLSINIVYAVLIYAIDPWLLVFLWAMHAAYSFHATAGIAVSSHIIGYRTYNTDDHSRNSFLLQFVTNFEGWHNNHHNNPGNYRHGEKWWEFDPPAWIIEIIRKR
jgi:stearoyl-CoA desaturase (delta-9 desaturase)